MEGNWKSIREEQERRATHAKGKKQETRRGARHLVKKKIFLNHYRGKSEIQTKRLEQPGKPSIYLLLTIQLQERFVPSQWEGRMTSARERGPIGRGHVTGDGISNGGITDNQPVNSMF